MTPPPRYFVERGNGQPEEWRLVGQNGLVDVFASASEAQADFLNERVADKREDDA